MSERNVFAKWCRPIPQRAVIATMVMTGLAIDYMNRVSFNLAITVMNHRRDVLDDNVTSDLVCDFEEATPAHHERKPEFHWTGAEVGLLLGAFYYGYFVTQIPGGILADLYGPKRVLGYGALVTAVITLLTPLAARADVYLLAALRVVMGLAQGPLFPSISVFTARWSLPAERNFMSCYMTSGLVVGAVLGNAIAGLCLYAFISWDTLFYVYGTVTIAWYFLWVPLSHDSPASHPFISEEERQKISEALKGEVREGGKLKLPLCAILKSVRVWAMILGNFGHEWAYMVVVVLLPHYMAFVLHFNVKDNGILNSLPFICMFVISLGSAKISELVISKNWMSKTAQCKLYLSIANVGPSFLFLGVSYAGCSKFLVVAFFTVAVGLMGTSYASVRIVNVDMAPNFAGTLMALMNGIGALASSIAPLFFSWLTKSTVQSWRLGFFLSSGVITITTLVFIVFGSSELQSWNGPPDEESPPPPPEDGDGAVVVKAV